MSKIIIENRSTLDDAMAVSMVGAVITKGRLNDNGSRYCSGVEFDIDGDFEVYSYLRKKFDRFIIVNKASHSVDKVCKSKVEL